MTPPTRAARPSSRPVLGNSAAATVGAAAGAAAGAAGLATTSARTSAAGRIVVGGAGRTTAAGVKVLTKLALRSWVMASLTLRPLLPLTVVAQPVPGSSSETVQD